MATPSNRSQRALIIAATLAALLGTGISTAYAGSHKHSGYKHSGSKHSGHHSGSKHSGHHSSKHGYGEQKLYGTATQVNGGAGTFVVSGVNVQTDAYTRFQGYADNYISAGQFFSDIASGQVMLKVEGYTNAANQLIARKVEYAYAQSGYSQDNYYSGAYNVKLKGSPSQVNAAAGTLVIQGLNVTTDATTYFEGEHNMPLSAGQFFAALQPGVSYVELKGVDQGNGQVKAVKLDLKYYYGY